MRLHIATNQEGLDKILKAFIDHKFPPSHDKELATLGYRNIVIPLLLGVDVALYLEPTTNFVGLDGLLDLADEDREEHGRDDGTDPYDHDGIDAQPPDIDGEPDPWGRDYPPDSYGTPHIPWGEPEPWSED